VASGPRWAEDRFPVLVRQFHRLLRAARHHRENAEDHRAVAVADIPLRPLGVSLELVTNIDGAVLNFAPSWAPTAVRSAVLDGEVQSGAIRARLPARDYVLDGCHNDLGRGLRSRKDL
jgi:hypothetical protein